MDELQIHTGTPIVEIRAQGTPNLLHETVHLVLAECLDHDHGIDYSAIPFDLNSPSGRQVLADELACCVVSCGYIADRGCSEVDAWFAEQLEIQPVFYGLEGRFEAFIDRIRAVASTSTTIEDTVERAYTRCVRILKWSEASPSVVYPKQYLTFDELMVRQGWSWNRNGMRHGPTFPMRSGTIGTGNNGTESRRSRGWRR